MKIGILTLPLHTNYGGILQAYALQTVLERMGHKVDVLGNRKVLKKRPLGRRILSMTKRFILHYIFRKKEIAIDRAKEYFHRSQLISVNTQKFISKHIHERIVDSLNDISPNDYDAIIVGSDQIWRSKYNHAWKKQKEDDVYLGFTRGWNIVRIAYAASFGTDKIEVKDKYLKSCQEAISLFDSVSVRESSGVDICKKILGVDAVVMPDPTLILTSSDYISIIPNYKGKENKNQLFSYILDNSPNKAALREKIAKEKNLVINIINKADNWKEGDAIIPKVPVEEWLKALAECDYVITDSFHACVFSIIFHKQFIVIANKERGVSRFQTLIDMFSIKDRLIFSPNDYHQVKDINYNKVDEILRVKRNEALQFLKNNLN